MIQILTIFYIAFDGPMTTCNYTSFYDLNIPEGQKNGLLYLRNDITSQLLCKQNCEFYPNCKSYFYNRKTEDCFILTTEFSVHAKRIQKIGAPVRCLAKVDKCVSI